MKKFTKIALSMWIYRRARSQCMGLITLEVKVITASSKKNKFVDLEKGSVI